MDSSDPPKNSVNTLADLEILNRSVRSNDSGSATVPLLLNPVYSRTKSVVFDELRNFRISLKWCALDHSSLTSKIISYISFIILTFLIPAATSILIRTSHATSIGAISFNELVQLPESGLAAISFFTLSTFFRRYGLRQLLFLDGLRNDSVYVRHRYARELDKAFKYLTYILLPSFSVELAHKIIFFSTVSVSIPYVHMQFPLDSIAFVATLASWVYRTGVFLLVCVLFRLTCELQILRLEGFWKMLEGCGSDAGDIFREHMRIKKQLLVTSHRYRIFILGCLVTITISQLGALLLVLASKSEKNFCNSGDLVVCSAVQLSGFFMCLLGAAKITHRAQRVVSIASRWHMIMTHASNGKSDGSLVMKQTATLMIHELDASDCAADSKLSEKSTIPSSQEISDFESRQALVMYLQHNGGGITLFGFPLDRGLLHTIFAFEMTLVLWILSKVVVLS